MKTIDYIIVAVIALIVAAVATYIVRKKLKGEKIGCGCDCQSCPHAGACGGAKPTEDNTEKDEACEKCREKRTEEKENTNDEAL